MHWFHRTKSPRRGLGLLHTAEGLALAQTQGPGASPMPQWHWQPHLTTGAGVPQACPDPAALRLARQRSGFQAQATAMVVPDSLLHRFSLQLEPGMTAKQTHAQIQSQLQTLLPWPLAQAVWDYHLSMELGSPPASAVAGPAWLLAALQAQALQTWEVLAAPRAWVTSAEHSCRAAGLALVRIEPPWQGAKRWQDWHSQAAASQGLAKPLSSIPLTPEQQAVLGGLALGVVTP